MCIDVMDILFGIDKFLGSYLPIFSFSDDNLSK